MFDANLRKIAVVSRAGTGNYISSSSPATLTFAFAPTYIFGAFINKPSETPWDTIMFTMSSFSTSYGYMYVARGNSGSAFQAKRSSDSKTLYFYADDRYTLNISGVTYYFFGIS